MFNKIIYLITYLVVFVYSSYLINAQIDSNYYRQFNENLNSAKLIYNIDNCYNTSLNVLNLVEDSSLANMNQIRFNFFVENKLYIVYGDINSLLGNQIKIFAFDTLKFNAIKPEQIDSSKIRLFSSIAFKLYAIINEFAKKNIDYNLYIINKKDTMNAFLIPIWQRNGKIIYGDYIQKKYILYNNDFKEVNTFKSNYGYRFFDSSTREIYLKYINDECPTIPSIFYTLAYKDIFEYVIIETKYKYTYLNNFELGSYTHIGK